MRLLLRLTSAGLLCAALLLAPGFFDSARADQPETPLPTDTPVVTEPSPPTETPSPDGTPVATEPPAPTETPSPADTPPEATPATTNLARLLVKYDPEISREDLLAALSAYGQPSPDPWLAEINVLTLLVPADQADALLAALLDLPGVLRVEADEAGLAAALVPADPGYVNQYALPMIRAPQAWDISTGATWVIVAVVDSGVDLTHPDLAPKLTAGYDFVGGDPVPDDECGHGTQIAGIVAAVTDNATGVAGVSWGARIMPVRVLDSTGFGTYENTAAGILWAVNHGAHVINLSMGGTKDPAVLRDAVLYAYSRGVTVVSAVGNYGSQVFYPAAYPQVIAVAAVDQNAQPAAFSNAGPEVDVAAPGVDIYTTAMGGGYDLANGTSFAAPFVAGQAALIIGLQGGTLPPDQVAAIITGTALDIAAPGRDDQTGAGLVQLDAALQLTQTLPTAPPSAGPVEPPLPGAGGTDPARGGSAPPTVAPTTAASATAPVDAAPPAVAEPAGTSEVRALEVPPPAPTATLPPPAAVPQPQPSGIPAVLWMGMFGLLALGLLWFLLRRRAREGG